MRGGIIAGNNLPVCSIRRRSPRGVFFCDKRLISCLYRRRDLNCFDLSGTRPFNRFRMHSHTQSTNGPLQVFMNVHLSLSDKRLSRLNSGRILCTRLRFILYRRLDLRIGFILLGDRRTALDRLGIFSCGSDTCRQYWVSDRSVGNRAAPSLRLRTTPRRTGSCRDTSAGPKSPPDSHLADS
jgi:hypothetical protein